MRFVKCLTLVVVPATLLVYACGKKGGPSNANTTPTAKIYVSGSSDTLGQVSGAYWVNDSLNLVSGGVASLNDISFANNNVYLLDNTGWWVNGAFTSLPDVQNTNTFRITVNGPDIYITGWTSVSASTLTSAAIYWKNGVQVNLTQNLSNVTQAVVSSLYISGSDVYAAGVLSVNYKQSQGVYWKNGNIVYLNDCAWAQEIAVGANGTVYVAGESATNGMSLWTNGTEQYLNTIGTLGGMAVSGNDCYVAGFTTNGPDSAAYWKNGQVTTLPNGSSATGIAVSGNDVYVCGNGGSNDAVYWKNGTIHILGEGAATGISVGN